jgi:hypothetical protein
MPAPDDDDEERYRTLRGAIADYARATEVEPPSRGLDELMAAARARVATRTPVEAARPGVWARLRAWLAVHPALASAAVMVLVGGIAGIAYVKQGGVEVTQEAGVVQREELRASGSATAVTPTESAPATAPAPAIVPEAPEAAQRIEEDGVAGTRKTQPARKTKPATAPRDRFDLSGKDKPEGGAPGSAAAGPGRVTESGGTWDNQIVAPENQAPPPPAPAPAPDPAPPKPPSADDDGLAEDAVDVETTTTTKGDAGDERGTDVAQLTRQARTAAKSKNCNVVKTLAARVQKADAAYYRRSFVTDADIKRCL